VSEAVVYLLDASSYIHRAFHAIKGLSTSSGLPTGAVYGFAQMLLKVLSQAQARYAAVVYDAKGPTFRHKLYPAYKANRPPMDPELKAQLPIIHELVTALELPAVEAEGYEADDLMATLAAQAKAKGFKVVLVSGDKDLYQLLDKQVSMWDTMKDTRMGPEDVIKKLGVGPEKVVDFMALTGDPTDNIPGVPGIGPKTAAKLINTYGDLEAILKAAPQMKQKKLREALTTYADQARLSRELVRLRTDAPVGFDPEIFSLKSPDPAVLTPLLARLEFSKLLKELAPAPSSTPTSYRLVTDPSELQRFIEEAKAAGKVAIDTETTSTRPMEAELVGFSLCVRPPEAIYVPLAHATVQRQMPMARALELLRDLAGQEGVKKVGQNLKYDIIVLAQAGVEMKGVDFDTMVADYLLNPAKTSHSLEAIAAEHLGRSVSSYASVTGSSKGDFREVGLEEAAAYAAEDAEVAMAAAGVLERKLAEAGLEKLFRELEMPLVEVLARMEMNGVLLDTETLGELSKELEAQLEEIQRRCYALAGHEFNINSPRQLAKVLFEELGLPQVKKTKKKTGYSTDMSVLTALAATHPLPAEVLAYRSLSKLKSTYVDALPALVNPRTGRIHTSFNQTVTATGRLSSSDPNLQNIPVRTELGRRIRACFIPGDGRVMMSADYSQIELRVMAHLSEDPLLLKDLSEGLDVHTQTASRLFDVPPEEVTPEMRRRAKTVNFGVLYGMSAFRLAAEQGISRHEAQQIIEKYLGRYKGVAAFQQRVLASAREKGYVETILGRRRPVPAINSPNRQAREAAERVAINTPIQGSAADIIKVAMLKVQKMIDERYPRVMMILQVHDELVFEVPEEQAQEFARELKQVMESAVELKVELKVDVGWGANWAEAH